MKFLVTLALFLLLALNAAATLKKKNEQTSLRHSSSSKKEKDTIVSDPKAAANDDDYYYSYDDYYYNYEADPTAAPTSSPDCDAIPWLKNNVKINQYYYYSKYQSIYKALKKPSNANNAPPPKSKSDSNYQLVIAKYNPKTDYEEGDKYVQFTGKNVMVVEVTCILD